MFCLGKQILGSAKQVVGKLVGDTKLQADGKAEQAEGAIQNTAGGLKDALKEKQASAARPPVHQVEPPSRNHSGIESSVPSPSQE